MGLSRFIRAHPVTSYLVLVFIISWGGMLLLAAPYGMPAAQQTFESRWPIVFIPFLLGPLIAGLTLTGLVDGVAGYRDMASRLVRWRVDVRWYALALLTAPALILVTLMPLSLLSPEFIPALFTSKDAVGLLLMGLGIGILGGGLMEEPGWTGFATPHLRRKAGVLSTGLVIGVVWGAWHLMPTLWGSGDASGVFDPLLFAPPFVFYFGVLPPYRVLIVFVREVTGSLLVPIMMHGMLTATTLFALAPAATGMPLVYYYLVLTVLMWGVALWLLRVSPHGKAPGIHRKSTGGSGDS